MRERTVSVSAGRRLWTMMYSGGAEDHLIRVETAQDIDPVLRVNQRSRNALDERAPLKGDMVQYARIPQLVYYDLERRGIADDDAALDKWLKTTPEGRRCMVRNRI